MSSFEVVSEELVNELNQYSVKLHLAVKVDFNNFIYTRRGE